jgi:hypothetical protein
LGTRLLHRLALRRAAAAPALSLDGALAGGETVPLAVAIGAGVFAAMRWGMP